MFFFINVTLLNHDPATTVCLCNCKETSFCYIVCILFLDTILDRALFKQKRDAQLDAIKRIIVMDGFDKQYKMINVVLEKLFKVMSYFH